MGVVYYWRDLLSKGVQKLLHISNILENLAAVATGTYLDKGITIDIYGGIQGPTTAKSHAPVLTS